MEISSQEKIAKILRVDKHVVFDLESQMERATGKRGVMADIIAQNDNTIRDRMQALGLAHESRAAEIYDALISKIESDDIELFHTIGIGSSMSVLAAEKVCAFVAQVHKPPMGYFLKLDRAAQFLRAEPPKQILRALGYATVDELLAKEDLLEVYSALRFLEDQEWQNNVFFKQYEQLVSSDFEQRPVVLKVLGQEWVDAAEKFVTKKHHNVSHLKELGVVFVIPIFLRISGETLRLLCLLFHYLHEITYYSNLFERFSSEAPERFAASIISLLRGDVIERRLSLEHTLQSRTPWLIVQRYLAKGDENDWRLFEPHINPEALHWVRAERDIIRVPEVFPNFRNGLAFWDGLDWVGDFFNTESGVPVLASFNLIDTVMSLVKARELTKYLYHQQEALWNKIFASYFSERELEEVSKKYIIQGWFEV